MGEEGGARHVEGPVKDHEAPVAFARAVALHHGETQFALAGRTGRVGEDHLHFGGGIAPAAVAPVHFLGDCEAARFRVAFGR